MEEEKWEDQGKSGEIIRFLSLRAKKKKKTMSFLVNFMNKNNISYSSLRLGLRSSGM
jgi:hypothetical protein